MIGNLGSAIINESGRGFRRIIKIEVPAHCLPQDSKKSDVQATSRQALTGGLQPGHYHLCDH